METSKQRISALAAAPCAIEIKNVINLGEAKMYIAGIDAITAAFIVYPDGSIFQQYDWQGGYPENREEIADFDWLAEDGRDAVVIEGLPRIF